MKKRLLALAGVLVLLLAVFAPVQVFAAGTIHSVNITVELAENGDAVVTETWELTAPDDITEWYLEKLNLDEQVFSDLQVWENGTAFEDVGEWDVSLSREEKAGKSGIVTRGDGYELCWGIGGPGRHTFTISYRVTGMVKQYRDAGVIQQTFLGNTASDIDFVSIVIRYPGTTLATQNTGVWASGTTGEINVTGGDVVAKTTDGYGANDVFDVLVQFADGMFSPLVYRDESFAELKERVLDEGSGYERPSEEVTGGDDNVIVFGFNLSNIIGVVITAIIAVVAIVLVVVFISMAGKLPGKGATTAKQYSEAPYSRNLPWNGSLAATYARLDELRQLENEGVIIGAYLLRWVRSRQVEIVKQPAGVFKNKEEDAIRLYAARPEMAGSERELYDIMTAAAGSDYILQSKEFEKWSRKYYERVQGWLQSYKNRGKSEMRAQGALEEVSAKVFFGLFTTSRTQLTAKGEQLTGEMFGFKRYLEDFTIINEREAREVQLWDEYMVYAQLFGIADKVAEQFRQLYPKYFDQMARDLGYGGIDMYDIFLINHLARSYSHAMATGYRAGYNASQNDSWSGGGGSFSGGGGFSGSSGGGFSGGR